MRKLLLLFSIGVMLALGGCAEEKPCIAEKGIVCYNEEAQQYQVEEGAKIRVMVENEAYGQALEELWNKEHPEQTDVIEPIVVQSFDAATWLGYKTDIALLWSNDAAQIINNFMPVQPELEAVIQEHAPRQFGELLNVDGLRYVPMSYYGLVFSTNMTMLSVEDEFKALVEACHCQDIKVIIDLIPRTNSVNSDLIAEHPDWFYWIEADQLDTYTPPFVPGVEPGSVADPQYLELMYASEEVLEHIRKFRPNPQSIDPEKWKRVVAKWKKGKGEILDLVQEAFNMTVAPAFSDCINDPQPAWNDITFFRMYLDHPAASAAYLPKNESFNPYILYDVAKASLNPGNRINEPLWALLSQIIPYYQTRPAYDNTDPFPAVGPVR